MATTNSCRWSQLCVGAVWGILTFVAVACADMGPKFPPRSELQINLRFPGGKPEGDLQAALLTVDSTPDGFKLHPRSTEQRTTTQTLPGLEARLAQEPNELQWYYCSAPARVRQSETIIYRPLISAHSARHPRYIRVAVYFSSEDRLFLTDSVETNRRDNRYSAVFEADGTGTLSRAPATSWAEENYILQIAEALAGTLLIEMMMVWVWMWFSSRGPAGIGRVMLLCFVGNLITVPMVWAASLVSKEYFGLETAWAVYLFAEVLAVQIEGLLYAQFGKLQWTNAILMSFAANCASFLCGCCLVSYY